MPVITPLQAHDKAAWLTLAQAYLAFYQTSRPDSNFEQLWLRLQAGHGLHALGARVDGQLVQGYDVPQGANAPGTFTARSSSSTSFSGVMPAHRPSKAGVNALMSRASTSCFLS